MVGRHYWDIRDYIDHRGNNVIFDALEVLGPEVKSAINFAILALRVEPPPLGRPLVGKLENKKGAKCDGLLELRVPFNGVQYRPIMYYGPERDKQQITLLGVATEKNSRFVPSGICKTCWTRIKGINFHGHKTVPHNFG
jgi:hypothetical protein